jgi:hypothetical protein
MEPTESKQNPLRAPSSISTKLIFIVWLVDSAALTWLIPHIWLHGSTPDTSTWMGDLGAVWGGTAAYLIGPFWKIIKQWPAPYRKYISSGALMIAVIVGILFWIRARQTAKLEALFKEDEELERNVAPKIQDFPQLLRAKQTAKSLPDYLQRCAELEPAINDYETVERQGDNLLDQMQQEIRELKPQASYGSLLPSFNILRAVAAKDIEVAEALRKEIEFAKQLPGIRVADRIQFYNANIQPIIEQERKIAQDEIEILKDAKRRGITLPESVYQRAGIVQGGQAAGEKTTVTQPNTQGGPISAGSPKQTFEEWEKGTH